MAPVKCHRCQRVISSTALSCPHCHGKQRRFTRQRLMQYLIGFAVGTMLILLGLSST